MTDPRQALVRLQAQMQRLWEKIDLEPHNGYRELLWQQYSDLEAKEHELLKEARNAPRAVS